MADSMYIDDLKQRLRRVEREIAEARRHVESGKPADKTRAAGELAVLEDRHKELDQRLHEAERDDAEDWSATHSGFREQLDSLGDALERWIGSHGGDRSR